MEVSIDDHQGRDVLTVTLGRADRLETTPDATVHCDAHVTGRSTMGDRGLDGLARRALGNESSVGKRVFSVRTGADAQTGEMTVAPDRRASIAVIDLAAHDRVSVRSGSLLAWTPGVAKRTGRSEWPGPNEGTVLALSGTGLAFPSAPGDLVVRSVAAADPLAVDGSRLVAWASSLTLTRENERSVAMDGGRPTRLVGEGAFWFQRTRPPPATASHQ